MTGNGGFGLIINTSKSIVFGYDQKKLGAESKEQRAKSRGQRASGIEQGARSIVHGAGSIVHRAGRIKGASILIRLATEAHRRLNF
jgi:hypothetical protein